MPIEWWIDYTQQYKPFLGARKGNERELYYINVPWRGFTLLDMMYANSESTSARS
jgi:hypothetical protein